MREQNDYQDEVSELELCNKELARHEAEVKAKFQSSVIALGNARRELKDRLVLAKQMRKRVKELRLQIANLRLDVAAEREQQKSTREMLRTQYRLERIAKRKAKINETPHLSAPVEVEDDLKPLRRKP